MGLANKITIVRILLVPFLISCFFYYTPEHDYLRFVALGIFLVCGLTDAIDGYIARRYYQKTKLGRVLDPLADKLLLLAAFLSLSVMKSIPFASRVPAWLTILVISRDVLIFMGSVIIFMMNKDIEIRPSFIGKATTFVQMFLIIVSLLQVPSIRYAWYLTASFTVASGLGYLWHASKVLNETH